jgi:hypothetical protein
LAAVLPSVDTLMAMDLDAFKRGNDDPLDR